MFKKHVEDDLGVVGVWTSHLEKVLSIMVEAAKTSRLVEPLEKRNENSRSTAQGNGS